MSRKGKNFQLLSAVELVHCVPTRGLVISPIFKTLEYRSESERKGLGEVWREETIGLITGSPILYNNILITFNRL